MNPLIITKTQLMKPVIEGTQRECFEDSIHGIFDVTGMRRCASMIGEQVNVTLDQIIPMFGEQRVVEDERVRTLDEESWKNDPGIMIVLSVDEDGVPDVVMVDGHHRAMRRHLEGLQDMVFWFIPIDKAMRPGEGWQKNGFVDWGNPIRDGKIIRG